MSKPSYSLVHKAFVSLLILILSLFSFSKKLDFILHFHRLASKLSDLFLVLLTQGDVCILGAQTTQKTTCRFVANNVSFYCKQRVVLLKTTCRFELKKKYAQFFFEKSFVVQYVFSIFAATESATLPIEQRTRAGLLLYDYYETIYKRSTLQQNLLSNKIPHNTQK